MYIFTVAFTFTFFIIGACIGSFINMAVYRTHYKLAFFGNSFCDKCKKKLSFKELIPILSFFINKGRCSKCGFKIPKSHVFIEAITGLFFATFSLIYLSIFGGLSFVSLNWFLYNAHIGFLYYLIIISCLIFIFIYDLKYFEVPYSPIIIIFLSFTIFTALSFIFYKQTVVGSIEQSQLSKYLVQSGFVELQISYFKIQFLHTFLASSAIGIFFLFLFLVTKRKGMGFGDVYTAPVLALVAGFPTSIAFIIFSFVFGATYGIYAIIFLNAGRKTAVPFAPFMVIGLVFSLTLLTLVSTLYL